MTAPEPLSAPVAWLEEAFEHAAELRPGLDGTVRLRAETAHLDMRVVAPAGAGVGGGAA